MLIADIEVVIDFAMSLTQIILSLLLPPDYPNLLQTLTILSTISLVITILFALEIILHLSVFGYKYYLSPSYPHWFLHLLDAVVIMVTLVLEIVLGSADGEDSPEREVVGLLIVLRLWRIVKILEAVAIGVGRYDEDRWVQRVHILEEQNEHLKGQLEDERRLRENLEIQLGGQTTHTSQPSSSP